MGTSIKQDQEFKKMIGGELPTKLLQCTIDWIRDNMDPEQVFPMEKLVRHVAVNKFPEEVYHRDELIKALKDTEPEPPAMDIDGDLDYEWPVPESVMAEIIDNQQTLRCPGSGEPGSEPL